MLELLTRHTVLGADDTTVRSYTRLFYARAMG
jgi:hypothetical protein